MKPSPSHLHGHADGQRPQPFRDQREARRPAQAVAAPHADALTILAGDDAVAVIFDLMQPFRAGRRGRGERWDARRDEAGRVPAIAGKLSSGFAPTRGRAQTPRYRAELLVGRAWRCRPAVATEARPSVCCTKWIGAPRKAVAAVRRRKRVRRDGFGQSGPARGGFHDPAHLCWIECSISGASHSPENMAKYPAGLIRPAAWSGSYRMPVKADRT